MLPQQSRCGEVEKMDRFKPGVRPQVAEYFAAMTDKKSIPSKPKLKSRRLSELEELQVAAMREAMAAANLKQKDLMDILGMSESNVSRLLDGKISLPKTPEDWGPIARAIGAKPSALNEGKYVKDWYWFAIRTVSTNDKFHELLANEETRRLLLAQIDNMYGQHVVVPSTSR